MKLEFENAMECMEYINYLEKELIPQQKAILEKARKKRDEYICDATLREYSFRTESILESLEEKKFCYKYLNEYSF